VTAPGLLAEALKDFYAPVLAGPAKVAGAARLFGRELADGPKDPAFSIVIAPGVLQLDGHDLETSYWADARAINSRHPGRDIKRGEVTAWTRKSRARMTVKLASLDWSYLESGTGLPAMITLTYPADWLPFAPDGPAVKRHLKALLLRWERAWGDPLTGAWKLEFQRRGAPHVHIGPVAVPVGKAGDGRRAAYEAELLAWQAAGQTGRRPYCRPAAGDGLGFGAWLAATWADIVGAPARTDVSYKTGMRCTDPKRLAIYFSKHGAWSTKEYQNQVPAEWREQGKLPGRFWGYWNLQPCTMVVPLRKREHLLISRTLRHLSERSHVWNPDTRRVDVVCATREITVKRHRTDPLTGEVRVRKRKVRRRVRRLKYHRGFVCLNDAPGMAAVLARLVGA